jgi:outer membrane protein
MDDASEPICVHPWRIMLAALSSNAGPAGGAAAGRRIHKGPMAFIRRLLAAGAAALLLTAPLALAQAADLRVGVVDVNRALNLSDAGQRSRKVLLAAKAQKENELKAKDGDLKKLSEELRSNIMLTEAARGQKEKDLRDKDAELRQQVQDAQRDLQEQERKLTESIFAELRTVIGIVAQDQKLDVVLEARAAETILFSRLKFVDITDEVIGRYNKIQTTKP